MTGDSDTESDYERERERMPEEQVKKAERLQRKKDRAARKRKAEIEPTPKKEKEKKSKNPLTVSKTTCRVKNCRNAPFVTTTLGLQFCREHVSESTKDEETFVKDDEDTLDQTAWFFLDNKHPDDRFRLRPWRSSDEMMIALVFDTMGKRLHQPWDFHLIGEVYRFLFPTNIVDAMLTNKTTFRGKQPYHSSEVEKEGCAFPDKELVKTSWSLGEYDPAMDKLIGSFVTCPLIFYRLCRAANRLYKEKNPLNTGYQIDALLNVVMALSGTRIKEWSVLKDRHDAITVFANSISDLRTKLMNKERVPFLVTSDSKRAVSVYLHTSNVYLQTHPLFKKRPSNFVKREETTKSFTIVDARAAEKQLELLIDAGKSGRNHLSDVINDIFTERAVLADLDLAIDTDAAKLTELIKDNKEEEARILANEMDAKIAKRNEHKMTKSLQYKVGCEALIDFCVTEWDANKKPIVTEHSKKYLTGPDPRGPCCVALSNTLAELKVRLAAFIKKFDKK
jgi:hypothetical protein